MKKLTLFAVITSLTVSIFSSEIQKLKRDLFKKHEDLTKLSSLCEGYARQAKCHPKNDQAMQNALKCSNIQLSLLFDIFDINHAISDIELKETIKNYQLIALLEKYNLE